MPTPFSHATRTTVLLAIFFLFSWPEAARARSDCKGLDTLRTRIQALWPFENGGRTKSGLDNGDKSNHLKEILDLASQCPSHFADTILLTIIEMVRSNYTLDSISHWIGVGESFVKDHGQYLSNDLYLQTAIGLKFQKYRHLTTLGYYDEAIGGFEKLLDELPDDHSDTTKLAEWKYAFRLYLGWLHFKKGDYIKSLEWYNLSHVYLRDHLYNYTTAHFEHLGKIKETLGDLETAKSHYFESEKRYYSIPDTFPQKPEYLLYAYINLIRVYTKQEKLDSVFVFMEKARSLKVDNPWAYMRLQQEEAKIYLNDRDHEKALHILTQALEHADSLHGNKQYRKGDLYIGIGEVHLDRQAHHPALKAIQKALMQFEESFNSGDFAKNPILRDSPLKFEMLKALYLKGKALAAWAADGEDAATHMNLALSALDSAMGLIQILRNDYIHDDSKEHLSQTSFEVFELAIETAHRLFQQTQNPAYLDAAFAFSEKSKALSLLESLTDIGAKNFAGIPDSLFRKEMDLKLQIAHYERKISENIQDDDQKKTLMEAIAAKRREWEQFRSGMEAGYPDYFNMKYNLQTPSPAEVGRQLAEDEAFVSFFWGDRNMYHFTITQDTAHWGAFQMDDMLRSQVETFRNLAASRATLSRPSNLKRFSQLGHQLYRQFIQPLALDKPKVLLAADAWLNLLPFDALLTDHLERDDYGQLPFLIHKHQITRSFSAAVMLRTRKAGPHKTAQPLLVIAPDQQLKGRPDSLAYRFGGDTLLYGNVTRERVFDKSAQYDNLLFYAHAKADTVEPFIQLHGHEKLFLRDLYAHPVTDGVVLLAACEAGIGQVKRGEGVMSLARGFAYGGASHVGLTLWEVQSGTTLDLSANFLHALYEKNMSPADAMHLAKLEFLSAPPFGDASPYLWSGFVMVGR